jgi:hypothetical protein
VVFVDYQPMTSYTLNGLLVYIFVIVAENNKGIFAAKGIMLSASQYKTVI